MSQNFHTDHFSCWHCDKSLTGSRYILKDDHPHCIGCYEELFAHDCEECKTKIGTDSKVSTHTHTHKDLFKNFYLFSLFKRIYHIKINIGMKNAFFVTYANCL